MVYIKIFSTIFDHFTLCDRGVSDECIEMIVVDPEAATQKNA